MVVIETTATHETDFRYNETVAFERNLFEIAALSFLRKKKKNKYYDWILC